MRSGSRCCFFRFLSCSRCAVQPRPFGDRQHPAATRPAAEPLTPLPVAAAAGSPASRSAIRPTARAARRR
jgi:hypothetical protein